MTIPAFLVPLLSHGLSLLGNAVVVKGREWVEEKAGVRLDGPLSDEKIVALKQFEMEHEEELIRLRQVDDRLGLDFFKAEAADRQSAREMNARVNESTHASWLTKNIAAVLAVLVISVGFALLAFSAQGDVRTGAVGLMTLVLGFYFGSSKSSQEKTDLLVRRGNS